MLLGLGLDTTQPFSTYEVQTFLMPANRFNGFKNLGVGIGLRVPHYNQILEKKPVVGWFEIISENYMIDGGRPLHILDQILDQYQVIQHGVSMYFGSAEPLNREHLKKLKALVRRTKTPWLSDHLCWGSVDGTYSHDLLPMPYTFEAARVTAQKIKEARDWAGQVMCRSAIVLAPGREIPRTSCGQRGSIRARRRPAYPG